MRIEVCACARMFSPHRASSGRREQVDCLFGPAVTVHHHERVLAGILPPPHHDALIKLVGQGPVGGPLYHDLISDIDCAVNVHLVPRPISVLFPAVPEGGGRRGQHRVETPGKQRAGAGQRGGKENSWPAQLLHTASARLVPFSRAAALVDGRVGVLAVCRRRALRQGK